MAANVLFWLHLAFRLGAIVDFIMLFPMMNSHIAGFLFNLKDITPIQTPHFGYGMRVGASLMLGWTLLLLWADRKPVQRKGVLLLTIAVIIGLFYSTYYASYSTNIVDPKDAMPIFALQTILIIIFTYAYVISQNVHSFTMLSTSNSDLKNSKAE